MQVYNQADEHGEEALVSMQKFVLSLRLRTNYAIGVMRLKTRETKR